MSNQVAETAATEINKLHNEVTDHSKMFLEKAIRIGELLHAQKQSLGRGQWIKWIEENLPFTRRTASNYMRLFENRDRIKWENVSHLAEAYELLTGKPALPPMALEEAQRADAAIKKELEQCVASLEGLVADVSTLRQVRDQKGYPPEFANFEEFLEATWEDPELFAKYERIADEVEREGLHKTAMKVAAGLL